MDNFVNFVFFELLWIKFNYEFNYYKKEGNCLRFNGNSKVWNYVFNFSNGWFFSRLVGFVFIVVFNGKWIYNFCSIV